MIRSPAEKLADAIRVEIVNFMNFSSVVTVAAIACEPWASITFAGARQQLRVTFDGADAVGAAADLLARLDDLEVSIPNIILADLCLKAQTRNEHATRTTLELEALTIDDEG